MNTAAHPITRAVDFEQDGVQHGWLEPPYGRDGSTGGAMMIPITVVENPRGPSALLTGGNHGGRGPGDHCARDQRPGFRATRRSPQIGGGKMNRVF